VLTQSTAGQPAGHTSPDLVLDRLPNGELAWLRPEVDAADQVEQFMARRLGSDRIWITDAGRRALAEDRRARAMEALFGQPWPTIAEASAA
jgi:hypothetical protein